MRLIEVACSLLLLGDVLRAQAELHCSDAGGKMHFSVNTARNETGHRIVKAELMSQYSRLQGQNGTGLDVLYTWGRCGDTQHERLSTIVTSTSLVSTSWPLLAIPAGYEHFPGVGYYKLYMTPLQSWAGAQQFCQSDGANLVVINSEPEADVIRKFYSREIPNLDKTGAWIGFHDQFKPGYYVTVFGETLSKAGYEKWASGHPVNSKHCGFSFKNGLLHTWQCEANLPFVCEL
ncbi:hemolymph lipopolysaccharide-binding protein-like [Anabrus simplex]|uniref:hemolymph lipopolysaccharide-binding protein-like n=1 Tax=Anabrus simplex TaxID=316456 RepID=UPI0035A27A28